MLYIFVYANNPTLHRGVTWRNNFEIHVSFYFKFHGNAEVFLVFLIMHSFHSFINYVYYRDRIYKYTYHAYFS